VNSGITTNFDIMQTSVVASTVVYFSAVALYTFCDIYLRTLPFSTVAQLYSFLIKLLDCSEVDYFCLRRIPLISNDVRVGGSAFIWWQRSRVICITIR